MGEQSEKKHVSDIAVEAMTFQDLGLDARLTRALARSKFLKPTLVQVTSIPIAFQGKDILCRARTGSGKTAAYTLPVIQKVLHSKEAQQQDQMGEGQLLPSIKALILVPTRELCEQVFDHLKEMCYYCSKEVTFTSLLGDQSLESQRPLLLSLPDIIVTTPSRIIAHLDAKNVVLKESLEMLVIDEADLILSFGYDQDLRKLLTFLPRTCQTFLMSATLTPDVEELKHLVLRNAAVLKLEEDKSDSSKLVEYSVKCSTDDKFLIIFFIMKLRLIKGKCIIFVNDIDKGFRLRLFLEQFGIKSCVLNAELPQNSRYHIVQEFNRGVYDYIIATDEGDVSDLPADEDVEDEEAEEEPSTSREKGKGKGKKQRGGKAKDAEYGVSRGVDFKDAAAVINFDFPTSLRSYTHRIGRTARGGAGGIALSLIDPPEMERFEKVEKSRSKAIKPFLFNMKDVEGFRYRVSDAIRAVTKTHIKEARLKELRIEIMNSEKLQSHFAENPEDLRALRHDKLINPSKVQPHMKHVPGYLLPGHKTGAKSIGSAKAGFFKHLDPNDPKNKYLKLKEKKGGFTKPGGKRPTNKNKDKKDPLKSFSYNKGKGKVTKNKNQ